MRLVFDASFLHNQKLKPSKPLPILFFIYFTVSFFVTFLSLTELFFLIEKFKPGRSII